MLSPFVGGKFKVTSIIGYRVHPITGDKTSPHFGLDLVGLSSKEITCVKSGTVVRSLIITDKSNATWQWGNYVAIQDEDGYTIYYCHMSKRLVQAGAKVKAGDVIGIEGATGQATGSHLHLEMRRGTRKCALPAVNTDICNVATLLGIKNMVGTYVISEPVKQVEDYTDIEEIIKKAKLMDLWKVRMKEFEKRYPYGSLFWKRIKDQLK